MKLRLLFDLPFGVLVSIISLFIMLHVRFYDRMSFWVCQLAIYFICTKRIFIAFLFGH